MRMIRRALFFKATMMPLCMKCETLFNGSPRRRLLYCIRRVQFLMTRSNVCSFILVMATRMLSQTRQKWLAC